MRWPQQLVELRNAGEPFVIVTVGSTRGSTPRETGAKMFVTAASVTGSIGGGQLEHECTAAAAAWLRQPRDPRTFTRAFTLGADCGQCCGGVAEVQFEQILPDDADWIEDVHTALEQDKPAVLVTIGDSRTGVSRKIVGKAAGADPVERLASDMLQRQAPPLRTTVALGGNLQVPALFEPLQPAHFEIVLFGAGHVGSAVVAVLAGLQCRVLWVDSRVDIFPSRLPENVEAIGTPDPAALVEGMASGAYYVVMTHSHALDLDICARVLAREDISYCGLIGSRSKRRQFEKRLRGLRLDNGQLARLTCPIGVEGISGKRPAEIAVALAAQLLRLREREVSSRGETRAGKRRARS